ncbi:hypothetical protein LK09_00700 [Microbacterium mangrovi]|uniref:Luciferase-like domain-containing protein n=1 Tax=Microbacterium mangrovi TaxID=1348253 RepID=A0A0B2A8L7_9MICO|nr:LLM class flavin-dependent oxidoreductase [Microbacterium mangrovi]KHK99888.1 hypothetical protein LK09_00700 [Microbacterium mangrovi]
MTSHPFAIVVDLDGDGAHPAASVAASHSASAAERVRRIAAALGRRAVAAERAGFTAVTFDDPPVPVGAPGSIDAVQRAAFAAPLTSAIGLIPVVQSVYAEPFHLATQLASLDLASGGRAGWIVGADPDVAIAARYGREPVTATVARRDAADTVEASRVLWDTWEDDAVVRDTDTWRYLDRDRVHYADFTGRDWSVKGPSIVPRPPQGQLPIAADASEASPAGTDITLVQRTRTVDAVRDAGAQRVWLELEVVLDRAGRAASDRLATLDAHELWVPRAERYVGDAEGLVALLTRLTGVVDGVRVRPAEIDVDADELGRAVIPALRRAGVFRSPTAGDTLRTSLGLPVAVNRNTREAVPA